MNIYNNSLASSQQLNSSPSWNDGVSREIEFRLRFLANNVIQTIGTYLHIDQPVISRAIVLVQRFYTCSSLKDYSIENISAASLLISSKLASGTPIKPGYLCYVLNFLLLNRHLIVTDQTAADLDLTGEKIFDTYEGLQHISLAEMELLAGISFNTNVTLPYSLALSYIQVLALDKRENGKEVVTKTWSLINDGIVNSPYLTIVHQPNTIAVTCIIVATTNLNIIISNQEDWWDLFDVNSEDIGHSMALILQGTEYKKGLGVKDITFSI